MDNIICLVAGAFIGSLIASVIISAVVLAGRSDYMMEEERRRMTLENGKAERERRK